MPTYKIIGADGKEYGPVTAEQMRLWIAEGRLNAQSQVLVEGTTEWRRITDLPEFASALPIVPPTLPTGAMPGPVPTAGPDQVNGPAIGLIVVGVLDIVLGLGCLLLNLLGLSVPRSSFPNEGMMHNEAFMNMLSGTVGSIWNVIGILIGGLVLFGGIKMRHLENYGLAIAAAIAAMVPCTSCCCVGIPIGIWALVILAKPEVKAAFH